jgi:hypothetical protein
MPKDVVFARKISNDIRKYLGETINDPTVPRKDKLKAIELWQSTRKKFGPRPKRKGKDYRKSKKEAPGPNLDKLMEDLEGTEQ